MVYCCLDPQPCPPEQILDGLDERLERRLEHRGTDDEDDIPTWDNPRIEEPHCFARTTLRAIAVVRLAQLLADHEPTTRSSGSVSGGVQNKQRMRPRFPVTAYTPKLLRATQPLVTPHGGGWGLEVGGWGLGGREIHVLPVFDA